MVTNEELLSYIQCSLPISITENAMNKFLKMYPEIQRKKRWLSLSACHTLDFYCLKCGDVELDVPQEFERELKRFYINELVNHLTKCFCI